MTGVQLARWGAAACAGGLTQRSAAKLAGVSRRHLQRLLAAHAADPLVQRDQALAAAIRWENQAGEALEEAVSRSLAWLRRCEAEGADVKETAAALAATVGSAHRLGEAGSRRAKRLAPQQQLQQGRMDLSQTLAQLAEAAEHIRQLPEADRDAAWAGVRQQLHSNQQRGDDAEPPIDVEIVPANLVEPGSDDE